MTLKKNILFLIILSVMFILKGFISFSSSMHEHTFLGTHYTVQQLETYKMVFPLFSAIGALIGGFWIDKWNFRRITLFIVLLLSLSSILVQFYNPYLIRIFHRIIIGFSSGFLIIGFTSFFTEISLKKHRGKFLFILLNATIIGSSAYLAIRYLLYNKTGNIEISYEALQIPFIFLPLLILLIIKHLPDNSQLDTKRISFNYFLGHNQRLLIYTMVILAILNSFANTNLYFYVTSNILFEQRNEELFLLPNIIAILAIVLGVILIDKLGRKKILLIGIITLFLSAVCNSIVPLITQEPFILFGFLYFYDFIFMFSVFTSSYIIILEYLPLNIRGRGLILFYIIIWIPNGINNIINKTLIFDSEFNVTIASVKIIITLTIVFILIRKILIETKGKDISEINELTGIE